MTEVDAADVPQPDRQLAAALSGTEPAEPPPALLEDIVGEFRSRYRTVGQSVLEILRESIVRGVYEPGERLRQEDLAHRIGVSRIPVRTALMQLESEGLVVFEPHRGATVRSLSADRLKEIYDLRLLLETHALRNAVRSLTDAEKAAAVEEAIQLDRAHEGSAFLTERVAFYRRLYDANRNPVTVALIDQLRVSIGRYRLGIRMEPHGFNHQTLAEAVQRGDVDTAEDLLREHLINVRDRMIASVADQ